MRSTRPAPQITSAASSRRVAGLLLAAGLILAPALAACESTATTSDATAVKATDTECTPATTDFEAGNVTFAITNGGSKVTEFYVFGANDSIVAERENIGPGTSANLTVDLTAGEYEVACKPGQTGDGIRQTIKVTGDAKPTSATADKAVSQYRAFVAEQIAASRPAFDDFIAAVKAGDIDKAKANYALSRVGWETTEPVAESFGDLDPSMDLRIQDVEPGTEWTGWHRIEKALWADKNLKGMTPIATKLAADYATLEKRIPTADMTVSSIGNGAKELLDEVATGKVTGEEEAYSRTDLVDFAANVAGAKKAYQVLRPLIQSNNAALVTELDAAFQDIDTELAKYGSGAEFITYVKLTKAQIDVLATKVDALAEPLSKLTAAAVKGQ